MTDQPNNEGDFSKLRDEFLKKITSENNSASDDPFEQEAMEGLKYLETDEDIETILNELDQRIEEEYSDKQTSLNSTTLPATKVRSLSWLWKAAAAILVFAIPAYMLLQQSSPEELYADHFSPFPNAISGIERGVQPTTLELKEEALKNYELEKHDLANQQFSKYLEREPKDLQIQFYHGVNLMSMDKAAEAITALSLASTISQNDYREAALWYLGLAQMKDGKIDDAKSSLQKVADLNGFFAKNAKKILAEI